MGSFSKQLFLISCGGILLGGYLLWIIAPVADPAAVELAKSLLLPNTQGVFPEPQDRFMYVGITAIGGLTLLAVAVSSNRSQHLSNCTAFVFWSVLAIAAAVVLLNRSLDVQKMVLFLVALSSAIVLSFVLSRDLRNRLAYMGHFSLYCVTAILVLDQKIMTVGSLLYGGPISSHYEAATSSIVRIAGGGTCLADVLPQYGCYGEFLAPVLRIFGSSIVVVSGLFSILLVIAISFALAFVATIIRNKVVLLGCSICLVMTAAFNLRYSNIDPYFQYYPLRFLFPAVSLPLVIWLQSSRREMRFFIAGMFAGVAMAWNLESGSAVFLSMAAFIFLGNFTDREWRALAELRNISKRLFQFLIGCSLSIAIFAAILFIKSGYSVDFAGAIVFQRVFAMTGFGMIPIPAFPGYWTIHLAILFAVLFVAAMKAGQRDRERDKTLELATYLALLGIGLTAYYVGRSHIVVLRLVMWPSAILLFFLLDRALKEMSSDGTFGVLLELLSATAPAAFLILTIPSIASNSTRVRSAPADANRQVLTDINFIRSRTSPGEPVAIISVNQGILYGQTATKPALRGPGVAELIRRDDLKRLVTFIQRDGPDKLFIGTGLANAAERGLLGTDIPINFEWLRTIYREEAVSDDRLIYMRRR